jgi:hypothetical protein
LTLLILAFSFGLSAFFCRLPWGRVCEKVLGLQITQTMAERLTEFSHGFFISAYLKT